MKARARISLSWPGMNREDGRQFQGTREHLRPSRTTAGQDAVSPVPAATETSRSATLQTLQRSQQKCR
ncbi:hypothetical protein MRX96_057355 [Rhipicephalus microplus]